VLGNTEWAAIRASRAIETNCAIGRGCGEVEAVGVRPQHEVNKDEDLQKVGNSAGGAGRAGVKQIKGHTTFAIHTHGSIGPSCAVAEYVDGKLTSWSASQQTHLLRKQMASMQNMKPDDVRCIYIEGAGCYGRNGHEDAAADAALIAEGTGVPVRRPVDRRRRARLGSEGAADFARLSRRPLTDKERSSVGSPSLDPGPAEGHRGDAGCCELANLPKEDPHPATSIRRSAIPTRFRT